jgi:Bifunctional DNA primase/polymerase, N-terminal
VNRPLELGRPRALRMAAHAGAWADAGYYVFALPARSKVPQARTHGFHDATRDERTILHAWDDLHANSNIGVSPDPSGAFILDIDSKHGADPEDVLTDLELDLDELAIIWTARAPERTAELPNSLSGVRGAHVWFRGSVPTGKTKLPGVEFRGRGGYGILPPSVHPSGDRYEGVLPHARLLPAAPPAVLELATSMPSPSAKVEDGTTFAAGERHEQLLAWARSRYTAHGVLGEAAWLGMLGKNQVSCKPPLPEDQVRRLWSHLEKTRIARSERAFARMLGRLEGE